MNKEKKTSNRKKCPEGFMDCFALERKVGPSGDEYGMCRICSDTSLWGPNSEKGKICPFYKTKKQVADERARSAIAENDYYERHHVIGFGRYYEDGHI